MVCVSGNCRSAHTLSRCCMTSYVGAHRNDDGEGPELQISSESQRVERTDLCETHDACIDVGKKPCLPHHRTGSICHILQRRLIAQLLQLLTCFRIQLLWLVPCTPCANMSS